MEVELTVSTSLSKSLFLKGSTTSLNRQITTKLRYPLDIEDITWLRVDTNFIFAIYTINILMTPLFDDFPKISDHFPKIPEDNRRFPNITEDSRGRTDAVSIIQQHI